jgi:hypothetical protein
MLWNTINKEILLTQIGDTEVTFRLIRSHLDQENGEIVKVKLYNLLHI